MTEIIENLSDVPGVDLDIIKTRLLIKGIIKTTSQMHIGIGADDTSFTPESGILLTNLIKGNTSYLIPYIPRSTIKGILRSEAEKIARSYTKFDSSIKVKCNNYPKSFCRVEQKNEYDQEINYIEPCLICRIFGGEDLASHIIFSDGLPNEETLKNFQTKLIPGIAIDRKKQVSADGSLFFIETLQPGAEFEFEMIINNISKETKPLEFKILRFLFKMVKCGFVSIGGHKSTGMGKFQLINTKIKELKMKDDFLFPNQVKDQDFYQYFDI